MNHFTISLGSLDQLPVNLRFMPFCADEIKILCFPAKGMPNHKPLS